MSAIAWEVTGGGEQEGILVRYSEEMTSKEYRKRLATGSVVEELKLVGNRLMYKLLSGTGPFVGWVSVRLKEKELLVRKQGPVTEEAVLNTTPKAKKPVPLGIRVCALTVAGNSVELNVERDFTVRHLRNALSQRLSQPPECLQIILGVQVLSDAEQLASHCDPHDEVLSVTVVITLDELYAALEDARLPVRQVNALKKLPALVPQGCDRTITSISKCLESKASSVRREAVSSLLEVAGRGNPRAAKEVEVKLVHENGAVRLNALRCWPMFLGGDSKDDELILSATSELSEDLDPDVKSLALDMLKEELKKKERGDPFVIALAQQHIKKYRNFTNELWAELLWVPVELAQELCASGDAIFCDSRDKESFECSHIPCAWCLPMEKLDNYQTLLRFIDARPQSPLIVYSDTGSLMSRCALVTQRLWRSPLIDTHRVFRLMGGLNSWKHHNFPVEGDPRPMYGAEIWDKSHIDDLNLDAWSANELRLPA